VLHSIGTSGAAVVGALRQVAEVPEQLVAARLFQAPSLLFSGLPRELAEQAAATLRTAGLECAAQPADAPLVPGDSDHEVALVMRDYAHMAALLDSVAQLLGVAPREARDILCTSPAVLLGRISLATVEALRRRFAPLGADLDVSRTSEARFDVFLGDCPPADRAYARAQAESLGLVPPEANSGDEPLLAAGLDYQQTERLWEPLRRRSLPVRALNRDFTRFDLRLEAAESSPELVALLVETAGMPERVVPRLLERLPVITHPNIRFSDLCAYLAAIRQLGGRASGQMIAFQRFSLAIEQVGDTHASRELIRAVAGASAEDAAAALDARALLAGPLTHPQAHWLQHELRRAGTTARLVLR
jgi:hypothetical protein